MLRLRYKINLSEKDRATPVGDTRRTPDFDIILRLADTLGVNRCSMAPGGATGEVFRIEGENMDLDLAHSASRHTRCLTYWLRRSSSSRATLREVMVQPLSRSLATATVDEEDLTPETAASLDRSRASIARGEGITHGEVLSELACERGYLPGPLFHSLVA